MIQKMRDFCQKMAFTATNITLLPPLLPPLNILYYSVLDTLVAVVAVKFIKYIVYREGGKHIAVLQNNQKRIVGMKV